MSWYTNLLPYDLERSLKHSSDRATTELTSVQNECRLAGQSADSHPLPLDLGGQSGETIIENVSALSRVALGCVGRTPWG